MAGTRGYWTRRWKSVVGKDEVAQDTVLDTVGDFLVVISPEKRSLVEVDLGSAKFEGPEVLLPPDGRDGDGSGEVTLAVRSSRGLRLCCDLMVVLVGLW